MALIPEGKAWPDDAGCCTQPFPDSCALCDVLEAGQRDADGTELPFFITKPSKT